MPMTEELEQALESFDSSLNQVIGMLIVPAMRGSDPQVTEAHQKLIDAANEFSDLVNEHLL